MVDGGRRRRLLRRGLGALLGAVGATAVAAAAGGCSLLSSSVARFVSGSGAAVQSDKLTGAGAVAVEAGTQYENIRALEYSLMFVNQKGAGGGAPGAAQTPTVDTPGGVFGRLGGRRQAVRAEAQAASYSAVFGTGWLFDYSTDAGGGQ